MDNSNDNTYYGEQFEEDSPSRPQLSMLAADYSDQYDDDNFEDDSNVQDKDRVSRTPIKDNDDYLHENFEEESHAVSANFYLNGEDVINENNTDRINLYDGSKIIQLENDKDTLRNRYVDNDKMLSTHRSNDGTTLSKNLGYSRDYAGLHIATSVIKSVDEPKLSPYLTNEDSPSVPALHQDSADSRRLLDRVRNPEDYGKVQVYDRFHVTPDTLDTPPLTASEKSLRPDPDPVAVPDADPDRSRSNMLYFRSVDGEDPKQLQENVQATAQLIDIMNRNSSNVNEMKFTRTLQASQLLGTVGTNNPIRGTTTATTTTTGRNSVTTNNHTVRYPSSHPVARNCIARPASAQVFRSNGFSKVSLATQEDIPGITTAKPLSVGSSAYNGNPHGRPPASIGVENSSPNNGIETTNSDAALIRTLCSMLENAVAITSADAQTHRAIMRYAVPIPNCAVKDSMSMSIGGTEERQMPSYRTSFGNENPSYSSSDASNNLGIPDYDPDYEYASEFRNIQRVISTDAHRSRGRPETAPEHTPDSDVGALPTQAKQRHIRSLTDLHVSERHHSDVSGGGLTGPSPQAQPQSSSSSASLHNRRGILQQSSDAEDHAPGPGPQTRTHLRARRQGPLTEDVARAQVDAHVAAERTRIRNRLSAQELSISHHPTTTAIDTGSSSGKTAAPSQPSHPALLRMGTDMCFLKARSEEIYANFISDILTACRARAGASHSLEETVMHRVLAEHIQQAFQGRDHIQNMTAKMVCAAADASLAYAPPPSNTNY